MMDTFPTLRRSDRMTPSKYSSSSIGSHNREASPRRNKPLRLESSPSRRQSPTRPNNTPNVQPSHGASRPFLFSTQDVPYSSQAPLRLGQPDVPSNHHIDPLQCSRSKHARNIEVREPLTETPFKQFGEWPQDSLITPLVNVQNRRMNQSHLPLQRTVEVADAPTIRIVKSRRPIAEHSSIFQTTNGNSGKYQETATELWRKLLDGLVPKDRFGLWSRLLFIVVFIVSILFGGQILEYGDQSLRSLCRSISLFSWPLARNLSRDSSNIHIVPLDFDWVKSNVAHLADEVLNVKHEIRILERLKEFPEQLNQVMATLAEESKLRMKLREDLDKSIRHLYDLQDLVSPLKKSMSKLRIDMQKDNVELQETTKKLITLSMDFNVLQHDLIEVRGTLENSQAEFSIFQSSLDSLITAKIEKTLLVVKKADGDIQVDGELSEYLKEHLGSQFLERPSGSGDNHAEISALNARIQSMGSQLHSKSDIIEIAKNAARQNLDDYRIHLQEQMEKFKEYVDSKFAKSSGKTFKGLRETPTDSKFVDFALDSAGARPVLPLSSKSYESLSSFFRLLPWTQMAHSKPHRAALSADNSVGNCWALCGRNGTFGISLAVPISPTLFTLEHLSADHNLDRTSAPKTIEIHAVPDIRQPKDTILLGSYTYRLNGPARQEFHASFQLSQPCRFYQAQILTNHGHPDYTCIYHVGILMERLSQ